MQIAPKQKDWCTFLVSVYYYLAADAEEHRYAAGVLSSEQVPHISSSFL